MSPLRRWVLRLIPLAMLAASSEAAADLTGHWHVEIPGVDPPFTDIVQTGGAVTFALTMTGVPLNFTGTVNAGGLFASSNDGPCQVSVSLSILSGETTMVGVSTVGGGSCFQPTKSLALMTRCDCFDGNTTNGDGCDAECRTEPCFVCTGDPSTCTPAGDGAACDDRSDCTTGETCSAGTCGGGSPVAPCVDLTGGWHRHIDSNFGPFDFRSIVQQRDGVVVFRDTSGGGFSYVGTIDTATGALELETPSTALFCSTPTTFTGTASLSTPTYSGTVVGEIQTVHFLCLSITGTEQGSRCGGGTLDPGETCDDGNLTNGDGCNDNCQVEECFACTGEPSSCSPQGAGPCDDGDPCTTGDACTGGGTCAGTPFVCASCTACDGAGGCIEGPRLDCHDSLDTRKSSLQITDKTPDLKDVLKWQWRAGQATMPAELGNPISTNAVATCLYDESAATPALLFRGVVPAGGICSGKPCWKTFGVGGFKYKNKSGADGIVGLSLRPGADGKAKVDVKGHGAGLSGRPFALPAPTLVLPLRMQVQIEGAGCFEVAHGAAGVIKNAPGSFKGRGTP